MIITERKIKGVFEVQLKHFEDPRGFFMRTYDAHIFEQKGLHRLWVQENHSFSLKRGTIRGMHFQFPPYAETKLVRVLTGEILDVFLDLRQGSSTFGQWDSMILSAENKRAVYIPQGFAHGFCTLTDEVNVVYKVDNVYAPDHEGTIKWNDAQLNIQWPVGCPILSPKDEKAPSFKQFVSAYTGLKV